MVKGFENVAAIARQLGPLKNRVVFVGGSVVGLLITDPAAPRVRYSYDVDLVADVDSYGEYQKLAERLRQLGFLETASEDAPICRWVFEGIPVDVMTTGANVFGFGNRWYKDAFENARDAELSPGFFVRLSTAPYFLAMKIEAFKGRGKGNYLESADMEDIIALIDGRAEIVEEVKASAPELREFLRESFRLLMAERDFIESLPAHLPRDEASQGRLPVIMERLRRISEIG